MLADSVAIRFSFITSVFESFLSGLL